MLAPAAVVGQFTVSKPGSELLLFGLVNLAEVVDSVPLMQVVTSGASGMTSSGFTL
jgi:hypothetical protein